MEEKESEHPVMDAIAKARKAQQLYLQKHDVQLEIDFEEEEPSQKKQVL